MTMRSRGYTPWTARKAPLLTKSLNETYIRLNSVALIVIVSLAIGLVAGAGMPKPWLFSFGKEQYKFSSFRFSKVETKPLVKIAVVKPAPEPVTETPAADNTLIVPAIPMAMPAADIVPSIPVVKRPSIEEILQRDYQLTMYEATNYVNAARQASNRTGIETSLLLAIAAESRKFKIYNGNKFVGIMGVNIAKHPEIIKTLKSEGLSYITAEGGFILGAEVLKKYQSMKNNDINAAVGKFMGSTSGQLPNNIQQLKTVFETALN